MKNITITTALSIMKIAFMGLIVFLPELTQAANSGFELGSKPSFVKDVNSDAVNEGAGEIVYWYGLFVVVIAIFIGMNIGYMAMNGKTEEAMERGKQLFIGIAVFLAAPAVIYGLFQAFSG